MKVSRKKKRGLFIPPPPPTFHYKNARKKHYTSTFTWPKHNSPFARDVFVPSVEFKTLDKKTCSNRVPHMTCFAAKRLKFDAKHLKFDSR